MNVAQQQYAHGSPDKLPIIDRTYMRELRQDITIVKAYNGLAQAAIAIPIIAAFEIDAYELALISLEVPPAAGT